MNPEQKEAPAADPKNPAGAVSTLIAEPRERNRVDSVDSILDISDAAVEMYQHDITPVRLGNRSKAPVGRKAWQEHQYADEAAVRKDFSRPSNLGIRLGNGTADVDLDSSWAIAAAPYLLPDTPVRSGKPSTPEAHCWYQIKGGGDLPYVQHVGAAVGTARKGPTLVELRADPGHQTMVPQSIHPDEGGPLRWVGDARPWDAPEVDGDVLAAAVAAVAVVAALAPFWPGAGSRHHAYLALAGALLRDAEDDARYVAKVEAILSTLATILGDEEADERVEQSIPTTRRRFADGAEVTGWTTLQEYLDADRPERITEAARRAAAALREAMGVPPEGGDLLAGITELGDLEILDEVPDSWGDAGTHSQNRIAARLATVAKGRCLYVHGAGWHWWDGRRWARDHGDVHVLRLLDALLRTSMTTALTDPGLLAAIKAASTASGQRGVLTLAAAREDLWAEEVDADPYLLNFRNGTLNLRTFELRPADPADRITKVTAAAYDPEAHGPNWERVLRESLPDPEVRSFLQRYVGLALLGRVEEHLMVFAYGRGRNAKGITAYTLQKALGDYGVTATSDLLVKKHHGKSAGDYAAIMQLRGARWGVVSELDRGTKVDVAALKSITGGDRLSAKAMARDFVNFDPSHTLFMLTNHLPILSSDEAAAWARVRVIPYEVSFEGREDTHLDQRLEVEFEGVLAWAVEGLREYRRRGMDAPAAVLEATANYRRSNDEFANFIEDRCELIPPEASTKVRSEEVREEFNNWVALRRGHPLTAPQWTARIEEVGHLYGVQIKRPGGKAHLYGLRLRDQPLH